MSRRRTRNGGNRKQRRDRELNQLWNEFFAPEPSNVQGQINFSSVYYREKLVRLIFAIFKIEGTPEYWDVDYILERLFFDGYLCICDTSVGVVPLQCGVTGINVFNHPTECIIANPILGNFNKVIDVNCVLMKLQWNYGNVLNLINRYAYMLANCDASVCINLFNTRVVSVAAAPNEKVAKECAVFYDQIAAGNPLVITDPEVATAFTFMPVKQAYIAGDIMDLKRDIVNEFLTEIGINNANLDKKERLNSQEVNSNNQECSYYIQNWKDNIDEGVDKSNKMFGLNWSMKLRSRTEYMQEVGGIITSLTGGDNNVQPNSND